MTKRLAFFVLAFLLLGTAGCGLVGWQGEPSVDRYLRVTGTMEKQTPQERSSFWTIETDTASYVPKDDLPPKIKKKGLAVTATGIIGEPPDFYPEGYFFDLRTIKRLDE